MGTTIPACKAAVLTLLAARPALSGVVLSWSGPTRDDDYVDELIFLGDTEDTSNWAAGGGIREENYALDVTVWVKLWGDDPQATEQRAHVLWDEVEDALRDDVMAGPSGSLRAIGVTQFNRVTRRTSTGPATSEKWGTLVAARVEFQAFGI
jgi:hypothetical protein